MTLPSSPSWLLLSVALALYSVAGAVELTFELPDSAKECFHEIIDKDTESTLEFQVSGVQHPSRTI